jgi:hypothetical protein
MKDKQIKLVLSESELKVVDELIRAVEDATHVRTTRTGLVASMFRKGVEDFVNRISLPDTAPTIEQTESA